MGGSFFINGALSIVSNTNKIWNCYLCDEGSAYALYNVASFSDTSSIYEYNSALVGGVISATKA
jgi:hypothetical protein